MIGCDKCDEWYHDKCVGLDIVSVNIISIFTQTIIPDIDNFPFTCPACHEKEQKKNSRGKKPAFAAP